MSYLTLPLLFALTVPTFVRHRKPTRTLAEMRDRYRSIVIFHHGNDERLAEQLRLLTAHRAGLLDRQIMLLLRPTPGPVWWTARS